MRKLTSKEDEAKRKKRNQLILGLILVAVMLFSTLGYSFGAQEDNATNGGENVVYNGYTFIAHSSGFWLLNLGDFQFTFKNTPKDLEPIEGDVNLVSDYVNKPTYVYSENQEAEIEIFRNLNQMVLRTQYACLDSGNLSGEIYELKTCDQSYPIKNCSDNFVIIQEAETPEIIQEENCVFIRGPKESLVKVADEFLFKIMGIK